MSVFVHCCSFAGHAALASIRLAARAFLGRRVRTVFRHVRAGNVGRFISGHGRRGRADFFLISSAKARVGRYVLVGLSRHYSVQAFRVIHVGLRLQLHMRSDVAYDTGVAIYLLEVYVLNIEACRRWSNGYACQLVVRCVFRWFVAYAVQGHIVGAYVVVCVLILVDGHRSTGVGFDAFSYRRCLHDVANDTVVRDRAVRRGIAIYFLLCVRVAGASDAYVYFFRLVRVGRHVLSYGSFCCLYYGRIRVVRDVVAGRRANLYAVFRGGRRATIRRRVSVYAGGVRRLSEFFRCCVLQRVRGCTVLHGDHVGNNRAVF